MKDQYDNDVPTDLVLRPAFESLDESGMETVDAANWYEANHPEIGTALMASAKALKGLSEDTLESATGVKVEDCEILYIAACLHRYNAEDGWYHA